MARRLLAAVLWLITGWYAGAFIVEIVGVPWLVSPILGIAAALLFAGDPFGVVRVAVDRAPADCTAATSDLAASSPS